MKGRIVPILMAVLVLAVLLPMSQSETIAQTPEPPDNGETYGAPDGPEISVQPAIGDNGETPEAGDSEEPLVVEPANPYALVSSAFTYQGKLSSGGGLVNGNCDFLWDLYAATSSGASLASDSSLNQAVINGLFTVVIDVPSSVIDGNGRYMEIQVRCPAGSGAYTTLTPRQELYAAPYALGLRLPFTHTISYSGSPIFAVTNTSGSSGSPSFLGSSSGGDGVRGLSTGAGVADNGVYGETNSPTTSEAGVKGVSTSSAAGGYFTSSTGYGVYGSSASATDYGGYFSNPAATSGAALYANGDAKQSLTSDGFVKAGVYIYDCGTTPSIQSYFNNVNTSAITVIAGAAPGRCIVDFNFDISDRYIVVTARINAPRFVTFEYTATSDRVEFFRYDAAGNLIGGSIMVLVY